VRRGGARHTFAPSRARAGGQCSSTRARCGRASTSRRAACARTCQAQSRRARRRERATRPAARTANRKPTTTTTTTTSATGRERRERQRPSICERRASPRERARSMSGARDSGASAHGALHRRPCARAQLRARCGPDAHARSARCVGTAGPLCSCDPPNRFSSARPRDHRPSFRARPTLAKAVGLRGGELANAAKAAVRTRAGDRARGGARDGRGARRRATARHRPSCPPT